MQALAQETDREEADRPVVLVTRDKLAIIQKEVTVRLDAKDYRGALDVLPTFSEKANAHANMIYEGAKPALEAPASFDVPTTTRDRMRPPFWRGPKR